MDDTAAPAGFPRPVRHVRLQVEVVIEITDAARLTSAALDRVAGDAYLPERERARAEEAVRRDEAEALAYLVDPFDLVRDVPGVALVQASWHGAHTDHDPEGDDGPPDPDGPHAGAPWGPPARPRRPDGSADVG